MFVGSRTRATRLNAGYSTPDDTTILEYAERALEHPSDAYFRDETLYVSHTLGFYWAPDSDDMVAQSNHRCILEDLSTAYRRYPDAVEEASIGHWTYSRFNCIRIRVVYSNGEIHPAFADAVAIWEALEGYPLYSDDDHSELESEEWDRAISEAVNYSSEEGEWSETKRGLVYQWLWENVAYQHECGYVPDDDVTAAEEYADERISATVAAGLPERLTGTGDHWQDTLTGI